MDKKVSTIEIKRIAADAKITFHISVEIFVLKEKAFKALTGSSERGGTYNYFQDRVLINRSIAGSYALPHLEWMVFHEYGHAYFARTFAKNSFFPMIVYAPTVEDSVVEDGVRHIWNGLCDCFVNELVLMKRGLKKFDTILENTIDKISNELAFGMCFHLYDYWKHGQDQRIAQRAKEKIPPEIIGFLEEELSLDLQDSPIDQIVSALAIVVGSLFPVQVGRMTMQKRDIEKSAKATLPGFWGDENTNLELLQIK